MFWTPAFAGVTTKGTFYEAVKFCGIVKTLFSRKVAKNAKEKPFNINELILRFLRLGVIFWLFTKPSSLGQ